MKSYIYGFGSDILYGKYVEKKQVGVILRRKLSVDNY